MVPMSKVPDLTDFQFLVIEIVRGSEMSGKAIREALGTKGRKWRKDGPAFYMAMSRLEKAGLIEGWYAPITVDGHKVKERRYKVLGLGEKAYHERLDFCRERVDAAGEIA